MNQSSQNLVRIIISGGHLTAALPVINEVLNHSGQVFYLGRKYASLSEQTKSFEKNTLKKLNVKYSDLPKPIKLNQHQLLSSIIKLPQLISNIRFCLKEIQRFKPNVALSFGGYIGLPLVIAAKLSRLPVLVHEQTATVGIANQISSYIANAIAVAHKSSINHLPSWKTIKLTGNPLRQQLLNSNPRKPEWLKSSDLLPIILVVGGSQGSNAINTTIFDHINILCQKYTVIHSTGDSKAAKSSSRSHQAWHRLDTQLRHNYFPRKWLSVDEYNWLVRHARLIISRSGANTINEIMCFSLPSILIPLPHAHRNEQALNAQLITQNGAGIILPQNLLSPEALQDKINQIESRYADFKKQAKKLSSSVILDASSRIYGLLTSLISS